jgi:multidrug efflux pump subunit AcrB
MWIVRLALRRPYTFVVFALLIAVLGVMSAMTMSVDIFPSINIPVVTVIWIYSGLSPTEMEGRIVTVSERAFTTNRFLDADIGKIAPSSISGIVHEEVHNDAIAL